MISRAIFSPTNETRSNALPDSEGKEIFTLSMADVLEHLGFTTTFLATGLLFITKPILMHTGHFTKQ